MHAAVGILGVAAAGMVGHRGGITDPWQAACAVTGGLLLANTNRRFPPLG